MSALDMAGLWLDGVKLTPHQEEPVIYGEGEDRWASYWYRFKVDGLFVRAYVDFASRVELTTENLIGLIEDEEDYPENRTDLLFSLWVRNSNVKNCGFTGDVRLDHVNLENCYLSNSELKEQCGRVVNPIKGLRVWGSFFNDFVVSNNGCFTGVRLLNSGILNDVPDTDGEVYEDGLGYEVTNSHICDTRVAGFGKNTIDTCVLEEVNIAYKGYLYLGDLRLNGVNIDIDHIDCEDRLSFFTMDLPKTVLHFYETRGEDYAVAEQDGEFYLMDDPEFPQKLRALFVENKELLPDDLVGYVIDCVASRINVLEKIRKKELAL